MKDALDQLIAREVPFILVGSNAVFNQSILMPGSFNPLHSGHENLLSAAEKTTKRNGLFELSITNVDKPSLAMVEVERRILQMKGRHSVVLTCAPTFAEKAELFPGCWFAMGYDTAVRLLNPKYHDDISAMLQRFQALGTCFVVAGRLHDGEFTGLESLNIPAGFEALFIPIPENIFREDISSTELRGE